MALLFTTTASRAQLPVWMLEESSGASALFTFADNGIKRVAKQTPSLKYFPYTNYPNGSQDATWIFSTQHNANPTVPTTSATPALRFYTAENITIDATQPPAPRRNFNDATRPATYPNVPIIGTTAPNVPTCYSSSNGELDLEGPAVFAYPDVLTMPAPGSVGSGNPNSCDRFYSIFYRPLSAGSGALMSYITDYQDLSNLGNPIWYGTIPVCRSSPTVLQYFTCGSFLSATGKVAVSRPSLENPAIQKQNLYLLLSNDRGQGGIYFFQVDEHVPTTPGNPGSSFPLRTIITGASLQTPGVPQTQTEARCISTLTPNCATASFESPELEISTDNKRLAWAENNKLYVATIVEGIDGYGAAGSNGITVVTATLPSAGTINGLEFAPGTYDVYVTFDATTNANDGLYKFTYNIAANSYATTATPNARDIKNSYIEANRLGQLAMLSPTKMERYDVSLATPGFVAPISFAAKLPPTGSQIRRLPRQIDGWHYGYAGDVIGKTTVQTIATPAGCTSPPPIQPITGQATYSINDLGVGAAYTWTVTPSTGVTVSPSGPTATITFPVGVAATYEVRVVTAYPGQTPCGRSTDARLSVATTDGCTQNGGRATQSGGSFGNADPAAAEVVVWPNPAADEVSISAPSAEGTTRVTLRDLQGRTLLAQSMAARQPLTLRTANIPAGVYLLTGTDGTHTWRQRLIITR